MKIARCYYCLQGGRSSRTESVNDEDSMSIGYIALNALFFYRCFVQLRRVLVGSNARNHSVESNDGEIKC